MEKYPIGIQTFSKIREGGFTYVDKTHFVARLLKEDAYFFLSRPRRFGKSLLLSTIKEVFQGSKHLFEGLAIEPLWDWSQKASPVLHFSLNGLDYKQQPLETALMKMLHLEAERCGLVIKGTTAKELFASLVFKLFEKSGKVVILIDEYDKPVIDYLENPEQAIAHRDELKNFFGVIKDSDAYLRFVLITGVSKFSKISIFSELNNLQDISLRSSFNDIAGITQDELEASFPEGLAKAAESLQLPPDAVLLTLKDWYNGYSWNGISKVYNPFSLLNFFESGELRNFWFETGTPTFLAKEMQAKQLFEPSGMEVSGILLNNFDLENLHPITMLFQTGYLTVLTTEHSTDWYKLGYPNREVRLSFEQYLLAEYLPKDISKDPLSLVMLLRKALESGNLDTVFSVINSTFAGIPSELWQKENEHFFHALLHLTFSLLGVFIKSEVNFRNGRADAIVELKERVYIFEFKLDKSPEIALAQIKLRGYSESYRHSGKSIIEVGVAFSSANKNVSGWLSNI
jgi:hypothetical protein